MYLTLIYIKYDFKLGKDKKAHFSQRAVDDKQDKNIFYLRYNYFKYKLRVKRSYCIKL